MSKHKRSAGLFDYTDHQERVSKRHTPLQELNARVDWERFRSRLEELAPVRTSEKGGRPAYDRVMMFKVLIVQELYGLSDEQTEYQILDRTSFRLFLGMDLQDSVPDRNTIWTFRQQLISANGFRELFEEVQERLLQAGLRTSRGKIVDATIIEVPVQRNTRDENQQIKNDRTPEEWSDKKTSHKDTDASWTRKHGKDSFGYKQHIKIDAKTKIIEACETTTASLHDSKMLEELITRSDKGCRLFADSAYNSREIKESLEDQEIINRIQHRAYRSKPLTKRQHQQNKNRSRVRSRCEHVFAALKQGVKGVQARCVGIARVEAKLFLRSTIYNIRQFIRLTKRRKQPALI